MEPYNVSDFHKIYASVDENGDGFLSPEEVNNLLQRLGIDSIPSQELCEMMSIFSGTKYGHLTIHEFADFHKCLCDHENQEEEILKAFNVYDLNRDGFISAEEIFRVISSLGFAQARGCLVSDCQRMIQCYDKNMDGLIDFSEFKSMMMMASHLELPV